MTYLAKNITFLPNLGEACDRITARAKAENEAEERRFAVDRVKRMIDDPRGHTDAKMATALTWFMRQSGKDRDDDGNVYYQRADELLFAINLRQQAARNKAKLQATVAAWPTHRPRRRGKRLAALALGYGAALSVAVLLRWAGVV